MKDFLGNVVRIVFEPLSPEIEAITHTQQQYWSENIVLRIVNETVSEQVVPEYLPSIHKLVTCLYTANEHRKPCFYTAVVLIDHLSITVFAVPIGTLTKFLRVVAKCRSPYKWLTQQQVIRIQVVKYLKDRAWPEIGRTHYRSETKLVGALDADRMKWMSRARCPRKLAHVFR